MNINVAIVERTRQTFSSILKYNTIQESYPTNDEGFEHTVNIMNMVERCSCFPCNMNLTGVQSEAKRPEPLYLNLNT